MSSRPRKLLATTCFWVVVFLGLLNLAVNAQRRSLTDTREKNLLVRDVRDGESPRFDYSVGERLEDFWPFIPDATKTHLVVLSGMSQMYAINDSTPGDKTISELLDDQLEGSGSRVFGLAAPNLCNEEALLLLMALASQANTKPACLVYGVCFDKFRNVDLRPGYRRVLKVRPGLLQAWRDVSRNAENGHPLAAAKMAETARSLGNDEAANAASGRSLEGALRETTGRVVPLVAARRDLNVSIQLQVFLFRNWLLRIKPTSKRPVLQHRLAMNKEFLGLMADVARESGITLALYVIPLNPHAENPYVPDEYAAFKTWLEGFCRERAIPHANLEGGVPEGDWGEFMGGPDFKHFRGAGHRATAAALLRAFPEVLTPNRVEGGQ